MGVAMVAGRHKYHQYGVEILTRLQTEAGQDGQVLVWAGPISTLIAEIAGTGNVHEMKKRLLEHGAIKGTSEEKIWEVADYDPETWSYDANKISAPKRPLTRVELREDMLDRLTQYMNEIRASLNVMATEMKELRVVLGQRETEHHRQLTFEEFLYEPSSEQDEGGTADGGLPT
jgi:hypothetical protein